MKNTALKLKIYIILAYTQHVGLYFIASINLINFFSFLLGVRALFGAWVFERLKKLKLSHYTTRRRLGGEEVQLLFTLDLGTRWV
jgi:hypothetical protein